MTTIADVRKQYPQYADMSDAKLADALHAKFYSDMPRDQFNAKIGLGGQAAQGKAKAQTSPQRAPALSSAMRAVKAHDAKLDKRDGARGRDAARAMSQGYTFGVADELLAARDALSTGVQNLVGRGPGFTAGQAYDARMKQEADRLAAYRQAAPGKSVGAELVGAVANPVNFIGGSLINGARTLGGGVARAAAVGGATGAAYGAGGGTDAKSRVKGAVTGGVAGSVIGGGLQGMGVGLRAAAARAAAKPISPARALANEGVGLTPGQMAGGVVQRAEDAATSIPILGDSIRGARIRGLETFNRAAIDRALAPIGQQLPEAVSVGRDGVAEAAAAISATYDQALAPITVAPDAQFAADLAAIKLPKSAPKELAAELKLTLGDIRRRLAVPVSGNEWKVLDSDVRSAVEAAGAATGKQASQRYLRDATKQARTALQDLLARSNPTALAVVKRADEATANLARVRQAAQMVGAKEGIFTPGQLSNAVRSTDNSVGNRAYAQGEALMQNLSDPAQAVLPSTVPDSGTPFRSLMGTLGLTGGGVALGADPVAVGVGVGGLLGAGGLYSRPAQEALNALYRSATPGQARIQLAKLSELAAREPALQALVAQLRERLDDPANGRSGSPQGLLQTQQR